MAKYKCHHQQSITKMKLQGPAIDKIGHQMMKDLYDPNFTNEIKMRVASTYEEPMGTTFKKPPFACPTAYQHHLIVNRILHKSFQLQKEEDVLNCSAFVSFVVSLCFKALNIKVSAESGNRRIGSETSPHMWIFLDESIIIDNCYSKTLTKDNISTLQKKYPKGYEKVEYSYSSEDLSFSDKETIILMRKKKLIELFKQNSNKALALCLNRGDLSNYFFGMIRFMWCEYKLKIAGIHPRIRYICWHCGNHPPLSSVFINGIFTEQQCSNGASAGDTSSVHADPERKISLAEGTWKFPVCGSCEIASYCSSKCHADDWSCHKFTCQPRSSACIFPSDGPD